MSSSDTAHYVGRERGERQKKNKRQRQRASKNKTSFTAAKIPIGIIIILLNGTAAESHVEVVKRGALAQSSLPPLSNSQLAASQNDHNSIFWCDTDSRRTLFISVFQIKFYSEYSPWHQGPLQSVQHMKFSVLRLKSKKEKLLKKCQRSEFLICYLPATCSFNISPVMLFLFLVLSLMWLT